MDTDQEPSYSVPANLTAILKAYGLSTPPAHVTPQLIFDKLISKVGCIYWLVNYSSLARNFLFLKMFRLVNYSNYAGLEHINFLFLKMFRLVNYSKCAGLEHIDFIFLKIFRLVDKIRLPSFPTDKRSDSECTKGGRISGASDAATHSGTVGLPGQD